MADDQATVPQSVEEVRPPARQCGRCRMIFEGDPTVDPIATNKWWLCPACRAVLLPRQGNSLASRTRS
jgi:hypothetical protein